MKKWNTQSSVYPFFTKSNNQSKIKRWNDSSVNQWINQASTHEVLAVHLQMDAESRLIDWLIVLKQKSS